MEEIDWATRPGIEPFPGEPTPWISELPGGTVLAGNEEDGAHVVVLQFDQNREMAFFFADRPRAMEFARAVSRAESFLYEDHDC